MSREHRRLAEPLLTAAQAGLHLGIPRSTIAQWAAAGLLHSVPSAGRHRPTMPLAAVAEAQVLDGLRRWGVSGVAVRRAVRRLHAEFGEYGLLTQRLATDGVALLRDLGADEAGPRWERVVDGQAVLPTIVDDHVHLFEWDRDGAPQRLTLRSYARYGADVILDPRFGYGQPVFAATKVRVLDVVRQVAAGETTEDVADDFALAPGDVRAALRVHGQWREPGTAVA